MDVLRTAALAAVMALAAAAIAAPLGAAHAQQEDGGDKPIPDWVRQIFVHYANGQISDAEIIAAITYLIDMDVIQLGQSGADADAMAPEKDAARAAAEAASARHAAAASEADAFFEEYVDAHYTARGVNPAHTIDAAKAAVESIAVGGESRARAALAADGTFATAAIAVSEAMSEQTPIEEAARRAEAAAEAALARAVKTGSDMDTAAAYEALAEAARARMVAYDAASDTFKAAAALYGTAHAALAEAARGAYDYDLHKAIEATGEGADMSRSLAAASKAAAWAYASAAAAASEAAAAYAALATGRT